MKAQKIGSNKPQLHTREKIFIGILSLLLIVVVVFIFLPQLKTELSTSGNILLAKVNGEQIFQSDLDARWRSLPVQYRMSSNQTALLEDLINEKLLLQECEKKNIVVNDSEVQKFIELQLKNTGLTLEKYKASLEKNNESFDVNFERYRTQLLMAKLLSSVTNESSLEINDNDIETFYHNNIEEFYQPPEVDVQHILLTPSQNLNETAITTRANTLLTALKNGSLDFCTAVKTYSSDRGSIDSCGEYRFKKGVMNEIFENASFEMAVGEYRIIKTNLGTQILHKIAEYPAQTLSLDDEVGSTHHSVRDIIRSHLLEMNAKSLFDNYLLSLKKNATIVYYT